MDCVLYASDDGGCPLLEWMDQLPTKVQHKCIVRIERLGEMGHELGRPEAAFLRDGIHELRVRYQGVNYRILYGFHGRNAVLLHGLTKERRVRRTDIETARRRLSLFATDPGVHTFR